MTIAVDLGRKAIKQTNKPLTEKQMDLLTLFILATDKQVLWQTVKTRMKCCLALKAPSKKCI